MTTNLRAVVFRENDYLVAQCLEMNIGAQAKTVDELYDRLQAVARLEIDQAAKRDAVIPAAPARFFDMWDANEPGIERWWVAVRDGAVLSDGSS